MLDSVIQSNCSNPYYNQRNHSKDQSLVHNFYPFNKLCKTIDKLISWLDLALKIRCQLVSIVFIIGDLIHVLLISGSYLACMQLLILKF